MCVMGKCSVAGGWSQSAGRTVFKRLARAGMLLGLLCVAGCGGEGNATNGGPVSLEDLEGRWLMGESLAVLNEQPEADEELKIQAFAEIDADGFIVLTVYTVQEGSYWAFGGYSETYTGFLRLDEGAVTGVLNFRGIDPSASAPAGELEGFGSLSGVVLDASGLSLVIENELRSTSLVLERASGGEDNPEETAQRDWTLFAGVWDTVPHRGLFPDVRLDFDSAGTARGSFEGGCAANVRLTSESAISSRAEFVLSGCERAGTYHGVASFGCIIAAYYDYEIGPATLSLLVGNEQETLARITLTSSTTERCIAP